MWMLLALFACTSPPGPVALDPRDTCAPDSDAPSPVDTGDDSDVTDTDPGSDTAVDTDVVDTDSDSDTEDTDADPGATDSDGDGWPDVDEVAAYTDPHDVLYEDASYGTPDRADLQFWAGAFGLTSPVLSDASGAGQATYDLDGGRPSEVLLAPGAELVRIDNPLTEADIVSVLPW